VVTDLTICSANNYQGEESEAWVGEWMEKRGNRDEIVLATKFTINYRTGKGHKIQSNFQGNSSKSLHLSVNASLKKLKTDYIDLVRNQNHR
jgi:aryl-alcohol dehydrogenase-like predicted oxidoreductase